MQYGVYKKGFVLAITCLFIGASAVPSIGANISNLNWITEDVKNWR